MEQSNGSITSELEKVNVAHEHLFQINSVEQEVKNVTVRIRAIHWIFKNCKRNQLH